MDKIGKVMREFKEGKLKSSSGQKVTNPKQAIAIGISEQKAMKGYKMGGEPKAMVKKEVAFMKAKGAPKSMVKHEMAEMKGYKGFDKKLTTDFQVPFELKIKFYFVYLLRACHTLLAEHE